ncbi:MAG: riboflavin biosynthesis protein RibF [Oscillospiraceae bacterium]|nr:riboflavin biosynthesis protein RibF [Oscillospiraceae bacterium]
MIDITYGGGVPAEKTAVALGYFDGLHLGHVGVITAALMQKDMKPAVFTFNCDTTLPKFRNPEDIISFENKCELMQKIGVEYLFAPDFAEVCAHTAEQFVSEILVKRLNAGFACCGKSFRFGMGGCGDPQMLEELGAQHGIKVQIVDDVCHEGVPISSTYIRELIRNGKIEEANKLLGYDLWYRLPVIEGNKIGRTLEFPTINQVIPKTNIIPKYGVYKSFVSLDGRNYRGITNIGVKPTVKNRGDGSGAVMETHIIGFDGDLYGQNISVSLTGFIRPEREFSSLEELKEQIAEDKLISMK